MLEDVCLKGSVMNIVAIRDMSAGNESVGEMWQETRIFDLQTPIEDVVKWAFGSTIPSKKRLTITVPYGEYDDDDLPF